MASYEAVICVCLLIASIGLSKLMRMIPPELSKGGVKTFKRRRYSTAC